MTTPDGPLPPLAPGARGIPGVDHPATQPQPQYPPQQTQPQYPSQQQPGPWGAQPAEPQPAGAWVGGTWVAAAQPSTPAPPRTRPAPAFFPAIGWWGFGLSFGGFLPGLAGAALALSIVGILQARTAGRLLAPPVIGACLGSLALAIHVVLAVLGFASALEETANETPLYSVEEEAFLDELAADPSDVYEKALDEDLIADGYAACVAISGGDTADEAARGLDWSRLSDGEAIVGAADGTLCDSSGQLFTEDA